MHRLTTRTLALTTTLVLTGILSACNAASAPANTANEVNALRTLEEQEVAAFNAKDNAKAASFYADDAVMITPGGPAVKGKAALEAANKPMVADPNFSIHFTPDTIRVASSGDLAYTQGSYVLTLTNPMNPKETFTDKGAYVTTYGKQNGQWKILTDIVTSQVPMAPPPAAK